MKLLRQKMGAGKEGRPKAVVGKVESREEFLARGGKVKTLYSQDSMFLEKLKFSANIGRTRMVRGK